jgi:long-chain acyl-CoA synthetase
MVQNLKTDFITESMATTIPALFAKRVERSGNTLAYRQAVSVSASWRDYTWNDIYQSVCCWRVALQKEELDKGDRVAIITGNRVEWVFFDQAAQSLGCVVVSLYTTDTAENIVYILRDAGVRLLLVDSVTTWQKISLQCQSIDTLQRVWCLDKQSESAFVRDNIVGFIKDILPESAPPYQSHDVSPDDLATIIYTSGTTGKSKGVMLSHHNLLSNAEAVQNRIPAYPDDVFLSFLPMAHGFERTVEYVLPMMAGSCVTYARSITLLKEDLVIVRPTVFISAPRLYEKIYVAIQEKISSSKFKSRLFGWTVFLGWKNFLANQERGAGLNLFQRFSLKILQSVVSKKILSKLGGRLRVAVTGAAPLSADISRFFIGLGLPLVEGYGLTEAGPVVSGNSPAENIPGSVGRALAGVEVKIAENGELLVRSASVMQGYWQKEQETIKVIDKDGWLHTGDLAEIKDEHIYIRGRSKDILVTSTGEKIAPADVETTIVLDPLFDQAMIIGEGKPYLSAIIILNKELWEDFAKTLGLDVNDKDSLQSDTATIAILERLTGLLRTFPVYAQIRAVHLSCEPWTIENGFLTPTLKIRRHMLEEKFAQQIKQLYSGHLMIE